MDERDVRPGTQSAAVLMMKLAILAVVVGAAQWVIGIYGTRDMVHTFLRRAASWSDGAIYFGDSVLRKVGTNDTDRRTLPEMLESDSQVKIYPVVHSAYNVDVFLRYVEYLARTDTRPRLVIVPLNLRSFSPEWDSRPEYQFELEKFVLSSGRAAAAFSRPLSVFTDWFESPITTAQWLTSPVFDDHRAAGRVSDYQGGDYAAVTEETMRRKIVFHYRYALDPAHRKLRSLDALADLAETSKIDVQWYVTPIDLEFCESRLPGTREIVARNVSAIQAVLARHTMTALDLSDALPSACFDWKDSRYPNEHLNEDGRHRLAAMLRSSLHSATAPPDP